MNVDSCILSSFGHLGSPLEVDTTATLRLDVGLPTESFTIERSTSSCLALGAIFSPLSDSFALTWTSATSTGGGGAGFIELSSSATSKPIVAPIFWLACLNESDSITWRHTIKLINSIRLMSIVLPHRYECNESASADV
ncbi:hypothetical protein DBV15_11205 [Temnothorax longispinosus]|uniref:Uncharacterized protein n=1 Tax=Temnothorax longispinosus TaxID=300112 RepID=A0A4V3SCT5_9HYME|nr:hypothetical protein DBV15_11205 [Temnothorax longispinosus]